MSLINWIPNNKVKDISFKDFIKSKMYKLKNKKPNEKLTIDEYLKYKQLRGEEYTLPTRLLLFPIYLMFDIGLFVIVVRYAFGIEFSKVGFTISALAFRLWIPIIIAIVLCMLILEIIRMRNNIKVRKIIVSERRKNKWK